MFSAPLKCLVGNDPLIFGIPIFRLSTATVPQFHTAIMAEQYKRRRCIQLTGCRLLITHSFWIRGNSSHPLDRQRARVKSGGQGYTSVKRRNEFKVQLATRPLRNGKQTCGCNQPEIHCTSTSSPDTPPTIGHPKSG
eukprot:355754-Chlamydomonas_euryale.AAC.26